MRIFSINSIVLAGQQIELKDDAIVCFVGQNSSGKSSALRSIYEKNVQSNLASPSHVEECKSSLKEGIQHGDEIKKIYNN